MITTVCPIITIPKIQFDSSSQKYTYHSSYKKNILFSNTGFDYRLSSLSLTVIEVLATGHHADILNNKIKKNTYFCVWQ
jgi:hypothetical protein